ncbi:MAG: hypothetical protein JWQ09_3091, partial [Segetibacter sp.]|nr:hypothetical protein [Segetibacter sp.]
ELSNISEENLNSLIESADKTTYDATTQKVRYIKKVNNLMIFINDRGISIVGSLSAFYYGNNLYILNRQTLPLAITLLEDTLDIPLLNARITRLDLTQNIILDHHPSAYLKYFGDSNFQQRLEHQNGVEHRNGERATLFYNKREDIDKKKKSIPVDLQGLNIGRFEVRLLGSKSVNRHMGTENLTLGDLCKPDIYNLMYQVWGKSFDAIEKITDHTDFKLEIFRKPKLLTNQLTFEGIKSLGGHIELRKMATTAKRAGVFETAKQYSSARRKVRQLNLLANLTTKNPLAAELEQKVHEIVQYSI